MSINVTHISRNHESDKYHAVSEVSTKKLFEIIKNFEIKNPLTKRKTKLYNNLFANARPIRNLGAGANGEAWLMQITQGKLKGSLFVEKIGSGLDENEIVNTSLITKWVEDNKRYNGLSRNIMEIIEFTDFPVIGDAGPEYDQALTRINVLTTQNKITKADWIDQLDKYKALVGTYVLRIVSINVISDLHDYFNNHPDTDLLTCQAITKELFFSLGFLNSKHEFQIKDEVSFEFKFLHMDLKPDNVLLRTNPDDEAMFRFYDEENYYSFKSNKGIPVPVIIDFGNGSVHSKKTTAGKDVYAKECLHDYFDILRWFDCFFYLKGNWIHAQGSAHDGPNIIPKGPMSQDPNDVKNYELYLEHYRDRYSFFNDPNTFPKLESNYGRQKIMENLIKNILLKFNMDFETDIVDLDDSVQPPKVVKVKVNFKNMWNYFRFLKLFRVNIYGQISNRLGGCKEFNSFGVFRKAGHFGAAVADEVSHTHNLIYQKNQHNFTFFGILKHCYNELNIDVEERPQAPDLKRSREDEEQEEEAPRRSSRLKEGSRLRGP